MNGQMFSQEDEELAKLGYKQEFTRDFSWFSTFSFAFSISGLLATVMATFSKLMMFRLPQLGVFHWPLGDLLQLFGAGTIF
jgi:hypothetical protein